MIPEHNNRLREAGVNLSNDFTRIVHLRREKCVRYDPVM